MIDEIYSRKLTLDEKRLLDQVYTKKELGKFGEDLITRYLEEKGYIILRRNYILWPKGEIDILAYLPQSEANGEILAVEVKSKIFKASTEFKEFQLRSRQVMNYYYLIEASREKWEEKWPFIKKADYKLLMAQIAIYQGENAHFNCQFLTVNDF